MRSLQTAAHIMYRWIFTFSTCDEMLKNTGIITLAYLKYLIKKIHLNVDYFTSLQHVKIMQGTHNVPIPGTLNKMCLKVHL